MGLCTTDMLYFKGVAHRWLAAVTQVAPYTAAKILPVLKTSASAAVKQCKGGPNGRFCGFYWADGESGGEITTGAGEQMNVLSAVSNLLIAEIPSPATSGSPTGTSNGGGGGGGGGGSTTNPPATESTKPSMASRSEVGMFVAAVAGFGMYWLSGY